MLSDESKHEIIREVWSEKGLIEPEEQDRKLLIGVATHAGVSDEQFRRLFEMIAEGQSFARAILKLDRTDDEIHGRMLC